jgi:hypothetical protein
MRVCVIPVPCHPPEYIYIHIFIFFIQRSDQIRSDQIDDRYDDVCGRADTANRDRRGSSLVPPNRFLRPSHFPIKSSRVSIKVPPQVGDVVVTVLAFSYSIRAPTPREEHPIPPNLYAGRGRADVPMVANEPYRSACLGTVSAISTWAYVGGHIHYMRTVSAQDCIPRYYNILENKII